MNPRKLDHFPHDVETMMSNVRLRLVSVSMRIALPLIAPAILAVPSIGSAQAPAVYSACYVPLTGTVYRIKESGLKYGLHDGAHRVQLDRRRRRGSIDRSARRRSEWSIF